MTPLRGLEDAKADQKDYEGYCQHACDNHHEDCIHTLRSLRSTHDPTAPNG